MFKKIVSSLPFSPALVEQLSFYAKRLKNEEATRKMGLIFTVLALVVQSFAVFQPPENANASSANDFIRGGFSTKAEYIAAYEANTGNIKDLFTAIGITLQDLQSTKDGTWNSLKDGGYTWGHLSRLSYAQGERSYTVPTSSGGSTTFYYRPLRPYDTLAYTIKYGSTYPVLTGRTASGMAFALMKACGNLLLKVSPPPVRCSNGMTGTYPHCVTPIKMCTIAGKTNIAATDSRCTANVVTQCSSLAVDKILTNYQFTTNASPSNSKAISAYKYIIKRDGKVIETKTITSTNSVNLYTYTQSQQGSYTVEASVITPSGAQISPNCVKAFTITAPNVCPQNPKLLQSSPECQPCPGNSTIWINDQQCSAQIVQTKTAANLTQNNADAQTVVAQPDDKILYTLTAQNKGLAPTPFTFTERIDDVEEYANVLDAGGGTQGIDPQTKTAVITWPQVTIQPGQKVTSMFTVQVMSTIPALATGASNPSSYDCRMSNTFGNNVTIAVACPVQKQVVETVATELPHTGPTDNILISGIALAIVVFLYARTRQLKTEVRLIRRDFNTGTI